MYSLCTQEEATIKLAHLVNADSPLALEVNENKCFGLDQWLSLGIIQIFPPTQMIGESEEEIHERAIRCGHFTWQLPQQDAIIESLQKILGKDYNDKAQKATVEALQDITRRLCLLFPTFDPYVMCMLPFRRPATLVTDTSSVMQGTLDFVARFLYPMARIKVPIIVSVETTNMADGFLNLRRSTPLKKVQCLQQHLKSQGTQRVLMRTQLHSDTEVESPVQENDPWRVIFTDEIDDNGKKTGLTTVHRSLSDRLILDSARQHLSRLTPGHNLFVLTSDQGMARMALAEGLSPIFVEARKAANPLGRILTGTLFHPFNSQLFTVSLTSVLWEIATCFGSARLRRGDGSELIRVVAMSEEIIWFPYQSREDLLWCHFDTTSVSSKSVAGTKELVAQQTTTSEDKEDATRRPEKAKSSTLQTGSGAYLISLPKLFNLIEQLVQTSHITREKALVILDISSDTTYSQYRRFLLSGEFVSLTGDTIEVQERLSILWQALREVDTTRMRESFQYVPSFRAFLEFIDQDGRRPDWVKQSFTERRSATGAYKSLVEITASALAIPDKGICLTPNYPKPHEFSEQAVAVYTMLASTREEVLTGEWLEELAWTKGIHPITARVLLNEAYNAGLVNRFFEGSTPDPRFENHTLDVLESSEGKPVIHRYHLYHGNFMLTDRASVRIKLERKT